LEQDAATLDLPDASVDVIVSNLGINNFADPGAVLQTCFRVARPGSTLLLTTNLVGHMAEFYDVYRAVLIELGLLDRLATLDAHINHRGTVALTIPMACFVARKPAVTLRQAPRPASGRKG
jgi:arsenite methyltransferase